MGKRAKEVFGVEGLKALADKGYYNTADLKECELLNIETYVPKQESSNSIGDKQYYHDKFRYDKEENIYVCPAGQKLYPARIRTLEKVKYRDYKGYARTVNLKINVLNPIKAGQYQGTLSKNS